MSAAPAAPPLPLSTRFTAKRIFEQPVEFLITGEKGRLAVLTRNGSATLPHRFEAGKWEALELPAAHKPADAATLGIYFGRDNRPRLMGYAGAPESARMVYLRYKDGAWQDQRSELGGDAADTAALFGVLGEADPEVVCKVGMPTCLLKSRKGWKDVKSSLTPGAVIRAFEDKGYALTSDGVYRADDSGFTRVGPAAPWKTPATGFWVGPGDKMAVVEPAANSVHVFNGDIWRSERAPIDGARDVAGPAGDRWFAGTAGLAYVGAEGPTRVGDATWDLTRVILVAGSAYAGGESGVVVASLNP
jgi:hypothetical protein